MDRYELNEIGTFDPNETGTWVRYADHEQALAEKDRESVKWSELIGSFTRSQHRYLVEMERLKQARAKKDRELELADFTIKVSLEKIVAMDKEIQQIREHEFQRGYQEAEEKYQQLMEQAVRFAEGVWQFIPRKDARQGREAYGFLKSPEVQAWKERKI